MDRIDSATRSRIMSRNKSKGTALELTVFDILEKEGLVCEQHAKDIPGCPDILFREERVAVFIDGDFWHGWRFPTWSKTLNQYWFDKISKTRLRDTRTRQKLRRKGWTVIRLWEHQINKNPIQCIEHIREVLKM